MVAEPLGTLASIIVLVVTCMPPFTPTGFSIPVFVFITMRPFRAGRCPLALPLALFRAIFRQTA